jgi:cell division protein FtsN
MKDLRDLKSRYEFQLDNKQLVLLFAGMIVILILAFILGTLFGRNLYSAKTAEAPATVATAPGPPGPAPSPGGAAAEEGTPAAPVSPEEKEKQALVKELEAQKLPSPPPGAAPPAPGKPAPGAPAKPGPAAPAKSAVPGKTVAAAPVGPATKTPKPEPALKPEPSPLPASSSGPYCLQISASRNRAEADALKAKLAEKKFDAYVVKAEVPGKGTFFRVRVGHYKDKAQAEKALRIFKSHEPTHQDAFVSK